MTLELDEDIELVSKITSGFFSEQPSQVSQIVGKGSVNKVFVVELRDSKAVIRMRDDVAALAEYTKEAWCIEKAAARSVPVPAVLAVGLCEETPYLIQTYVEGDEGRDSEFPRSHIWQELGKHARLIHSIEVAGFGLKLKDMTKGDSGKSWLDYLEYNIESLSENDELIKLHVLTKSQSKIIRNIFETLKAQEFDFGLNHGDISLKNAIVDARGVVSLLDWGSAEAAIVPHHDLIQMLKMKMLEQAPDDGELQAFLDGYGIRQTVYRRMLPELENLLLLRAFDKLRWAIEWNKLELESFVNHAREAVELTLR